MADSQVGDASTDGTVDASRDAANDATIDTDARTDGGTTDVTLSTAERDAITEQTEFEIDTMLIEIRGASASAEKQTPVYRTAFAWGVQAMERICIVNDDFPEGCRSDEGSLSGDLLFAAFEPDVTFDKTWSGKVGELAGQNSLVVSGVPTTWSDELPAEPNTDSTFDISKHTESVKIELINAETQQHRWTRIASKVFVENRGDIALSLAHDDTTVARATPIDVGFDVEAINYEARYTALLDKDVTIKAVMISDGTISGNVLVGQTEWGTLVGVVEQDAANITIDWTDE